jgi:hypothetical protein
VLLDYVRGPGAEGCPDDQGIHDLITARLGYDPFRGEPRLHLRLSVEAVKPGLSAKLVVLDARGQPTRRREMASERSDCAELAEAITLATSLAIDPFALSRPPSPPPAPRAATEPERPPQATPAAQVPVPPPPRETPPREPVIFELGLAAAGSAGLEPEVEAGFAADARLRWTRFSVGVEGRLGLPRSSAFGQATVTSSLLFASVFPCAHLGPVAGCALISAGALRISTSGLDGAGAKTEPFFTAGARVELALPTRSMFFARVRVDVMAPLIHSTFYIDGATAWSAPWVAAALSLGGGARF